MHSSAVLSADKIFPPFKDRETDTLRWLEMVEDVASGYSNGVAAYQYLVTHLPKVFELPWAQVQNKHLIRSVGAVCQALRE